MVNPGVFHGRRKEFLLGERAAYAEAVQCGSAVDAIGDIWRRFFKRFPIDMPDDKEPTDEELAAVDDEAADPEAIEPDPEKMSRKKYKKALKAAEARRKRLSFKKAVSDLVTLLH